TTAGRAASDIADGVTMGMTATDKRVGNAWNRVGGIDSSFARGSWSVQGQQLWSATDYPNSDYQEGNAERVSAYYGTRHVGWSSYAQNVSPGFRSEAGFLPRAGFREGSSDVYYRWETGRKTGLLAWRLGTYVD